MATALLSSGSRARLFFHQQQRQHGLVRKTRLRTEDRSDRRLSATISNSAEDSSRDQQQQQQDKTQRNTSPMRIGLDKQGALLQSPSFLRNAQPIFESLHKAWASLAKGSVILELGSGSGEHSVFLSTRLPDIVIQPTDVDPSAVSSCNYRAEQESLLGTSILSCKLLDISAAFADWPVDEGIYDGALAVNVIHIASPSAVKAMFLGVGRALKPGALLAIYDTWTMQGEFIGPTNVDFDRALRARGYGGVRSLEECDQWAAEAGMRRVDVQYLPANNQMIYWEKS